MPLRMLCTDCRGSQIQTSTKKRYYVSILMRKPNWWSTHFQSPVQLLQKQQQMTTLCSRISHSDDELSIASVSTVASANIPLPPQPRNYPKPMSFHNTRRRMGKKQSRRHDNALQLETLVEESDFQEMTLKDFMQNPSPGFSRLFEGDNMEKWYEFMESSEEMQKKIIDHNPKKRPCPSDTVQDNMGLEFQRIKSGVRNMLKRSHVPVGMLTFLETDVVNFFTKSPQSEYISGVLSSFERLLLHGVAQYHQLCSFSRTDESSHTRHVHVWNESNGYTIPKILLSEYLESREQKSPVNETHTTSNF